jgi:GntR family transcriptional regulator, vanillate catabolism transcriptional regulator
MEKALAQGGDIVSGFQENPSRIDDYREVNVRFHDAIIASSRNRMLADIIKLTFARPGATHRNIVSSTHPEVRRRHDDHHRIFEALIAGDAWRAELLMREHVTSVKSSRLQTLP